MFNKQERQARRSEANEGKVAPMLPEEKQHMTNRLGQLASYNFNKDRVPQASPNSGNLSGKEKPGSEWAKRANERTPVAETHSSQVETESLGEQAKAEVTPETTPEAEAPSNVSHMDQYRSYRAQTNNTAMPANIEQK